jgi:hypothetical protein
MAARKAVGLGLPSQSPDDPWWSEGPHIEQDGRSYYVHAMGCLGSELGRAMRDHPDWFLIAAFVRGRRIELHGLDDAQTLAEVRAAGADLTTDELRTAIEATPAEKRRLWGVTETDADS